MKPAKLLLISAKPQTFILMIQRPRPCDEEKILVLA